jgi:tetratricopeptide (TPR) repeat protein
VTTASLAAFKEYLQGEAETRAGRFERAEEAYLRALAHDSTFALAHYRLSIARDWAARAKADLAARAAARHAERLTPRDRSLLEALQAYTTGDAPDAERRYRAILARYPDDLDAWFQLAEALFHFAPARGRLTSESEQAWRKILSYEPRNLFAIVHLARLAAADARTATLDSLLAPFSAAESLTDRRLLQVAALRAIAASDSSTLRKIVRSVRGWEDAAVWQFAAYLTAFSHGPAETRRALEMLIQAQRAPGMIADLRWFTALLHLQSGQLLAARRALTEANRVNAVAPAGWHRRTFARVAEWSMATLPLPYPDSMLERIRRSASLSLTAGDSQPAADDDIWFDVMHQALSAPQRVEALRLYTVGVLSLRLRDAAAAKAAATSLSRLAMSPAADWFARAFDNELRARIAWQEGRPEQALRILEEQQLGPVSVGSINIVPFMSNAHARYLHGELLMALGRPAEALPWFASLGALSVPESALRAPMQLRLAQIHERLGNSTEAAKHYRRFLSLWQNSDPALQTMVDTARRQLEHMPRR